MSLAASKVDGSEPMAWREGQVVVAEEVGGRVVVRAADGTARRVYGGEGVKADAALRGAGGGGREA